MPHLNTQSSRSAIYLLLSLLLCSLAYGERPNVIIIMTDDQGYGDLACHGNPWLKTPNLDQLHAESVRLTNFHVSPFCTPTRAALMTGRYPARTGAYRTSCGRTMMHTDERTIADQFTENGYQTGMFGKWHLGDNAPHRPQDRGFDDVLWHRCGGVGQASDFWGNDYFDDTYDRNGQPEKFDGYCTDIWFRESMSFIEQNKNQPFFLYLATNAPHGPYRVASEWAEPYQDNPNIVNANFYGMIANIDHNVGLLQQKLDELGIADNTILIFLTDNGTAAGGKFQDLDSEPSLGFNAGMRGKKSSIYEGGHRVPCFIHWPQGKVNHGRDLSALTAHIDIFPTLVDLCSLVDNRQHQIDGLSFAPLLRDSDAKPPRKHLLIQYHGGAGNNNPLEPWLDSCVLKNQWRLVNRTELYDISTDPAQSLNIASQHPAIVKQLRSIYPTYWESVSPRMTAVSIDIGNPRENPTILSSQDWYLSDGNPPWNFASISRLPKTTGPWNVHVRRAGKYQFTLRQYPREANKALVAQHASIRIAGRQLEKKVKLNSTGVTFTLELPVGKTQLVTRLQDQQGLEGGAYFTEVLYLGK